MDGTQFDEMTRRMTAVATRRRLLGVAAGLLGGAAIAGEVAAGAPPSRSGSGEGMTDGPMPDGRFVLLA